MFSLSARFGMEDFRLCAASWALSVCQNEERNLLQQKKKGQINRPSTWQLTQSSEIHKLYVLLQNSCRWSKLMIKYCCCSARKDCAQILRVWFLITAGNYRDKASSGYFQASLSIGVGGNKGDYFSSR